MSKLYVPGNSPHTQEELQQFVDEEHERISLALEKVWDLPVSNSPPSKPRPAMMRYADGVGWNPGNGEGLYIYKSFGWVFLG